MRAKIRFKGNLIEIEDIERIKGVKKYTGLMWKNQENAHALLFEFENSGKQAIHSLFCPAFIAIWLNDSKIVDYKVVDKPKFLIKPKENFNKLLEIPLNNKYSAVTRFFVDEQKI